jgi:F-type H+-transporting ATPase subunit b
VYLEILHEIGAEVAADPGRMVAEFVQFAILIGLIWVVGFGFGKRRGFVTNMISERRERIGTQLEEAQGADARLELAESAASEREQAARAEAERLIAEAKAGAEQSDEQVRSEADAEAARIMDRARTALENERAQMQADLREQLVELVSQASRSIMNEKLTVAEQRSRIEEAIVAGVSSASEALPAPKAPTHDRRRSRPVAASEGI